MFGGGLGVQVQGTAGGGGGGITIEQAAAAAPVQSVAGRGGDVALTVGDVAGALSADDAAQTYAPLDNGLLSNPWLRNARALDQLYILDTDWNPTGSIIAHLDYNDYDTWLEICRHNKPMVTFEHLRVSLGGERGTHSFEVLTHYQHINRLSVSGSDTGMAPTLSATGSDADVGMELHTKGEGDIILAPGGATALTINSSGATFEVPVQVPVLVGQAVLTGQLDIRNFTDPSNIYGVSQGDTLIAYPNLDGGERELRLNHNGVPMVTCQASILSLAGVAGGGAAFEVLVDHSGINRLSVSGARTGGSPTLSAVGTDANVGMKLQTKGTGILAFGTGGGTQMQVADQIGAVNFMQVQGAATTGTPTLSASGTDANVGMKLQTKGNGILAFAPGGNTQMQVWPLTNAVNYMQVQGGIAGNAVGWQAAGTDSNISAVIGQPRGTGAVLAQRPDGSATGGNARGINAVDLQISRTTASQVASGARSALHGGDANTASGICATVAGGSTNTADGNYSWVPGGINASPRGAYGKGAFAAGRFAANGDAQLGWAVLRKQTTDATLTRVTADAGAASSTNTLNLPNFGAFYGRLRVISKMQGSTEVAVWDVMVAAVRGNSPATTQVFLGANASLAPTASNGTSAPNWRLTIAADTVAGGIAVSVTGAAATTINTVATFDSTETVTAN